MKSMGSSRPLRALAMICSGDRHGEFGTGISGNMYNVQYIACHCLARGVSRRPQTPTNTTTGAKSYYASVSATNDELV